MTLLSTLGIREYTSLHSMYVDSAQQAVLSPA